MPPGRVFCFRRACRILVRQADAYKAAAQRFAVPEAGIGVVAQNRDRAVRLAAHRVGIQPQGFQRLGVECLNASIGQTDKQNAVRVGRAIDCKAGCSRHIAFGLNFACGFAYTVDFTASIDDQTVIHKDGAADRAVIPALAQRGCPIQHAVRRADWCLCVRNAVVAVCAAEIWPFCVKINNAGVRVCLLQRDRHRREIRISIRSECQALLPVLCGQFHVPVLTYISGFRKGAIIGKALGKRERSVVIRPDAVMTDSFIQIDLCVSRVKLKPHSSRRSFLCRDRIFRFGLRCELVRHRNADGFLLLRSVQLQRDIFK